MNPTDDGVMRKSKRKPGFLYELPGRKAVPFVPIHDQYNDSHLKKPSYAESDTATQVTSVIRTVVHERLASLRRTHKLQIDVLQSEHMETVKLLQKKIQGYRQQLSNSKKKLINAERSRSRWQTK